MKHTNLKEALMACIEAFQETQKVLLSDKTDKEKYGYAWATNTIGGACLWFNLNTDLHKEFKELYKKHYCTVYIASIDDLENITRCFKWDKFHRAKEINALRIERLKELFEKEFNENYK